MKKYEYKNAIVYITVPTEKQLKNIRLATKRFMQNLMSKGYGEQLKKGKCLRENKHQG